MFKYFPGTFTTDGRKVPIAEMVGWKEKATNDQAILTQWAHQYAHKIKVWMMPTGSTNGIIALDIDVKDDGYETAKKYFTPTTLSQRTKSGGLHLLYKYPQDGRTYGNRVKFDKGLDIRGENGYVAVYGFDNCPIAEAPEWLLEEALKGIEDHAPVNPEDIVKISPEIVKEIVTSACDNIRNAPEGESNNVLNIEAYKVGQLLPSGSISREEAFNWLFKAAKERGKPDYEAKATINSGFEGGGKNPFTDPFTKAPPIFTIPEMEQKIVDRWTPSFFQRYDLTNLSKLRRPQLFKDWSTEDISITTADGGTGKTTLKLLEAICLALGEPFLGFDCISGEGRTLFITGEDTKEKLGAILGAILKQMGLMDGQPHNEEKVRKVMNNILVKKESEMCLITKGKDGFIKVNKESLDQVFQAIEDLKPKMIVFDPISNFWGSESALNDMSKAVATFMGKLVERSNACVEVINHMGKASSKDKDMSQFAGRGGTGLPSHARVSRVLRPIFDEEFLELTGYELGDRSAILCNVNKFSDGSPLYNKPFIILREGFLFSKVTLVEQKVKEHQEKMSDTERIFTYIVEERRVGRYPTKNVIAAHFNMTGEKLSRERIQKALEFLGYMGHMGEKLKIIDNPDIHAGGKVYIITDATGKEI